MRACSHPNSRNGGHKISSRLGAAISTAREARGANFFAANPTAKCPINIAFEYTRAKHRLFPILVRGVQRARRPHRSCFGQSLDATAVNLEFVRANPR